MDIEKLIMEYQILSEMKTVLELLVKAELNPNEKEIKQMCVEKFDELKNRLGNS
jgi:hypothetical protein